MILDTIVETKKKEVASLKEEGIRLPSSFRENKIEPPRGFRNALVSSPVVSIIAEVKKASPSKGVISENFEPVRIAENYEKNGAAAVSVLTDVDYFQGSLLYLLQVRHSVKLPVLRKDFIIDEVQIREAAVHGADAVLLIASILDLSRLQEFRLCAAEYGMDSLVEVHNEKETELAVESGADLIGINNRNLKNFSMDLETTFRLKKMIPAEIPVVSESGLRTAEDIVRLREAGVSAALIGEALMRAGSDSGLLRELRRE
ncbi:indole-3-glycerol-phosphate synthase [Desulfomarina profundi]|uniref:Indole-3-glycerol phosphate synthase n=1 Tax=Desulfomarina profundi TaxID=2772557 RepID=A0A8D5FEU6_9BACT|nr:indole-3-glycerol phosphate synthase TrpC [Desulfomarina profundi]BCL60327.1 indole-3-glycerol-phosphate synthase [Desulfomarina profundi]